jgi:hypothetical protein
MSKKAVTQSKPAPAAQQPAKTAAKEAPKTVAKGSFDPSPWTKLGHPEEIVVEIKSAFDLFDTDQGGSIDTKGTFFFQFRTQGRHGLIGIRQQKRFNFPNDR